jgi:hypothetical protein
LQYFSSFLKNGSEELRQRPARPVPRAVDKAVVGSQRFGD